LLHPGMVYNYWLTPCIFWRMKLICLLTLVRQYVWCLIHQFQKKIVSRNFPVFTVCNTALKFVSKFKYLGNIITNDLQDDADIEREIKSLYVRCNVLISRFKYCSWQVQVKLFQTYCLCLYNPGLWHSFNKATMQCIDFIHVTISVLSGSLV